MTSPIEPPVNPESPPVSAEVPVTPVEEEIRLLARSLQVFQDDALVGRKAVVDAVALGNASTPPTVTVTLGGVSIANIRVAASYTPTVGDTVLLLKQANEFFAAFKIQDAGTAVASSLDGGFIKPTLNSGHGHNGNSNGDLMYRRVLDHGAWKIQWQGGITLGASDTILSAGNALASEYRPLSRRSLVISREVNDAVAIFVDFNTDGTVVVVGATEAPSGGGSTGTSSPGTDTDGPYDVSHSHGGSTGSAGDSHLHSHGGAVASTSFSETHTHSIPSTNFSVGQHSHTVNSHSHTMGASTVARPTFISFNGVEYFL